MPVLITLDRCAAILGRSSAAAIRDLVVGAHRWRLWYLIGSGEMRRRFARARLGQLWIMLSSALSVSITGFAWALLWKEPVHDILPFIAISVTVWQFLAAVLNDATTAFPQSSQYFLNQYMPASTIIYSVLYKNVATFLLNMMFPICIAIFLGDSLTAYSLLSVIGPSWCGAFSAVTLLQSYALVFAISRRLWPVCCRSRSLLRPSSGNLRSFPLKHITS